MSSRALSTLALTSLALIAFASNSILTRLALGRGEIDAATFTAIRLAAGALVLALVVRVQSGGFSWLRGRGLTGAIALLLYAAPFSFAYLRIGAAVGALVAFGFVQLSMIGYGIARGERLTPRAWLGLALACAGLGILTLHSASRPDPIGIALMAVAGSAWGAYSLLGRQASDALATNARSFVWATPPALLLGLVAHGSRAASHTGIALALSSGALTSGLGYAIWYRALRRLGVTEAAVAQLGSPIIAALGAAALLGEPITVRLQISGVAVLAGLALVLSAPRRAAP